VGGRVFRRILSGESFNPKRGILPKGKEGGREAFREKGHRGKS